MKDATSPADCENVASFWTRVAAFPLVFRVLGIPRDETAEISFRHLFFVYTSKEVLTLLAVIAFVLGGIPVLFTLIYEPRLLWTTLPIGLVPVFITFLTLGLVHLQVAVAALTRHNTKPVFVSSFVSSFLATALTMIGFFLWIEFEERGGFREVIADSPDDLVPWLLGALIYAGIAEFVTMFVLRYVLPTGSQRFTDLAYKRLRLRTAPLEDQISIGENSIAVSSIVSVEAQGNYVRIVTCDDEVVERITFSTVLDMLPEDTGVQVHRSRWVAYSGIAKAVSDESSGLVVVTTKGASLTVTQSRLESVTIALKTYQLSSGRNLFGDFLKK